METIKRYAITHLEKSGLRSLAFPNQGRNHYDTREQAEKALEMYREGLEKSQGRRALEVREVECYLHGDAVGVYFDTDYRLVTGTPFTTICCVCGKQFPAGDGREMYADTTGKPWEAYYCPPCSANARELQEVTRATR